MNDYVSRPCGLSSVAQVFPRLVPRLIRGSLWLVLVLSGVGWGWSAETAAASAASSQDAVILAAGLEDTDGDGMPNDWETTNGLDPSNPLDATGDPDGDGKSNLEEYLTGTDPRTPQHFTHILSTGQSLSIGTGGSPPLSTNQPYNNKMLSGTNLVPLVEMSREAKSSAMANMVTSLAPGETYQSIVTRHGVSTLR